MQTNQSKLVLASLPFLNKVLLVENLKSESQILELAIYGITIQMIKDFQSRHSMSLKSILGFFKDGYIHIQGDRLIWNPPQNIGMLIEVMGETITF